MPGIDGFGVISVLLEKESSPALLCLCHGIYQYCRAAFEVNAIDYLLKAWPRQSEKASCVYGGMLELRHHQPETRSPGSDGGTASRIQKGSWCEKRQRLFLSIRMKVIYASIETASSAL